MKDLFPIFLMLLLCLSCTENNEEAIISSPEPVSATEKAINQVVKDAYAVISFEKGQTPNYEEMRAIFTPDAMLHNFREDSLESMNITEFIETFKGVIDAGQMTAFDEVELGGETEYFGKVGHRISSYASYFEGSDEVGERGVNSFQVLNIDGQWRVSSIIWDIEKEGQPIPEKYLDALE